MYIHIYIYIYIVLNILNERIKKRIFHPSMFPLFKSRLDIGKWQKSLYPKQRDSEETSGIRYI